MPARSLYPLIESNRCRSGNAKLLEYQRLKGTTLEKLNQFEKAAQWWEELARLSLDTLVLPIVDHEQAAPVLDQVLEYRSLALTDRKQAMATSEADAKELRTNEYLEAIESFLSLLVRVGRADAFGELLEEYIALLSARVDDTASSQDLEAVSKVGIDNYSQMFDSIRFDSIRLRSFD